MTNGPGRVAQWADLWLHAYDEAATVMQTKLTTATSHGEAETQRQIVDHFARLIADETVRRDTGA